MDGLRGSVLHEVFGTRVAAAAVGPNRLLRLPDLIRLFQEAAMRNTIRLDLSSPVLIERYNLTWVLRRQYMEIGELPRMSEPVTVVTAPSGFARRLLTYRDFRLLDAEGRPLVRSTSEWLLMDMDSRRPRPIPPEILAIAPDLPDPATLLSFPEEKQQPPGPGEGQSRPFTVAFHQLDFNDHLTNPVYPELMVEPLGADFLRSHRPARVTLVYHQEARYGHVLLPCVTARKGGYAHGLYRGEELLAEMYSEWRPL